ncbi:hypothetical protein [Acinetobacter lwoffii]|uniref:hypothetical protein n=1 Tax=Acinetobacter lwoffii TaxID=28090 RepID=UPI0030CB7744
MKFKNILCLRLLKSKMIGYIDRVRCKITELALIGYNNEGAYSPLRAFFMRYISMHPHVMVGLDGNTYGCAGYLHYQSINPIQPRHPHLIVNGKALILNEGAHSS